MFSYRTQKAQVTADEAFQAMLRHARASRSGPPPSPPSPPPPPPNGSGDEGDVVYGGTAIARHLFKDDSKTARRRVFHLWTYYRDRKENAGLFKLKGALCLSKSKWRAFHGL